MKLSKLKSMLQDVIATLIAETDRNLSDKDIDYLINYALYEILNPQKDYVDDRPCDTEAPEQTTDNVIKVNFKWHNVIGLGVLIKHQHLKVNIVLCHVLRLKIIANIRKGRREIPVYTTVCIAIKLMRIGATPWINIVTMSANKNIGNKLETEE